jgi:DNA mismatch repair protein MutS2
VNEAGGRFDEATLATLEFPDVIEQIARHATCAPGAAMVWALAPYPDRHHAELDLALVDDTVAFFQSGGDFAFGGAVNIDDSLGRAQLGATLSAIELRDVSRSERSLAIAVAAIRDPRRGPQERRPLFDLTSRHRPTTSLVRRLDTAIDDDGAVLDAASPELAKLRRQQRALASEIRLRVDEIVRNPNTAKLLSEQIVTVRGGRYVVPVRIESASQLSGVVHDQSASGATVYVEPMACVEANNRLRGLEAAEAAEIQRILGELSAIVSSHAEDLRSNGVLLATLDSIRARARWADAHGALAPRLIDAQAIRLVRARHPLLRREAVPLDVDVGDVSDAIVISGPNMGGKTVVLKTLGLFCLLSYSGIPVPAGAGTQIGAFDHIACIVGDEQSIANDLSSFSAHLRALHAAQRRAGPHSLVLVDEIGSGTEPGAGAALAQAFIEALLATGTRAVVTTHYTQLKIFAASHERVANASMLFDPATLEPTYVLAMGVPGQSLAFALAHTLGLDPSMIGRAEQLLGADAQNLERAFEGLATERGRLQAKQADLENELERLRMIESELRTKVAASERERAGFEKTAAEALDRAVRAVRDELVAKAQRSEGDARRQRARAFGNADDTLEKTMMEIRRSLGLASSSSVEPAPNAFSVGDRVYVRSFGQPGIVSEIYDRNVLVTMGTVKAVVSRSDLTRDPATTVPIEGRSKADRSKGDTARIASLDASTSIDVRGMRVDEAMPIVDKALDDASLAGLAALRIVHGKGTGQLGRGIREFLRGHAQVQSAEFAPDREGGTGVTVVTLR